MDVQPGKTNSSNDFSSTAHPNLNGLSFNQLLAIYTALRLLLKMKSTLGLEAMLIYISNYIRIIERFYPELKNAVSRAVDLISIEKIYKEADDENLKV